MRRLTLMTPGFAYLPDAERLQALVEYAAARDANERMPYSLLARKATAIENETGGTTFLLAEET